MKRLPPQKRNQLAGVVIATVGLICAVYFMLIGPQNKKNMELGATTGKERVRLQDMKNLIKQKDASSNTLADLAQQIDHVEEDVASGDLAAWSYDTIRLFKANYHVDITSSSQPVLADCDLLPNFPYRQIRFTLSGTAYYHDLGKFLADFENKFPHCRVLNLSLEPALGGSTTGSGTAASPAASTPQAVNEHLNYRMDIVALVKPNT